MSRALYEDYQPGPIPIRTNVELSRYLDDELHRIAELKAPRTVGAGFAISATDSIVMEPAPSVWNVMYVGDSPVYDRPEGQWNSVTGVWTCALDGFYNVSHMVRVDAVPGAAGNRGYEIGAGIQVNGVIGDKWVRQWVALDTQQGAAVFTGMLPLSAEDTVEFMGDVVHEQFTVAADIFGYSQLMRV